MDKIIQGIIAGVIFGVADVLIMIPLPLPDKITAMAGSFFNRFAIGFFVAATDLPVPGWVKGLLIGFLLSLPDAIITKMYVPIVGIGILGGIVVGLVTSRI